MSLDAIRVGRRYIHAKRGVPVTLRYTGSLPPGSYGPIYLGVEYDDPALGKHDGVFEGRQVFQVDNPSSGAFVKAASGDLIPGPTFVQAIEERYGSINPTGRPQSSGAVDDRVVLGTSGIIVEAPGIGDVQKRIGTLERLREIGMDGRWVSRLGGDSETLQVLKRRLRGVKTLNLSSNLLCEWSDVQEIVDQLENLDTLVLNNSRIARLPVDVHEGILASLARSFAKITELHLGNAGIDCQRVFELSRLFPRLQTLHIDDNPRLTSFDQPSLRWDSLTTLSLSGCPLARWDDIVNIVDGAPALTNLYISNMPFDTISSPEQRSLLPITSIVMLSSRVTKWSDIDALERWTQRHLKSFRFSLQSADLADDDHESGTGPNATLEDGKISGRPELDRPLFVASLSGLNMYNSSLITSGERRDAELYYVNHVRRLRANGQAVGLGRYDELCAKIQPEEAFLKRVEGVRSSALKSKMLNLRVCMEEKSGGGEADISTLPSAPASLLRRKIAKKLDLQGDFSLYTARLTDEGREKVTKLEDDQQVGSWMSDGETIMVVKGT